MSQMTSRDIAGLFPRKPSARPVCFVLDQLLMTTQTTSPTATCLSLTTCEASPQHKPNNVCVHVRARKREIKIIIMIMLRFALYLGKGESLHLNQ